MLVLTRKKGESVIVGENIEIMVTDVRGNKVRIGILAPKGVKIDRKEAADRRQTQPTSGPK